MRSHSTTFALRRAALFLALACGVGSAQAQLTVLSDSATMLSGWSIRVAQDPAADVQASHSEIDLVGDDSRVVFIAAQSADTFFFRVRLNTPDASGVGAPGVFDQVAAIGIDINRTGRADIAFAVTGKNGPGVDPGQSYFMAFGESLSSTPSTTSWGSAYGAQNWLTSGASSDFNYSLVSSIDGAVGNTVGSTGPNTFLTFAVSFARLQDAIRSLGGAYSTFVVDQTTAGAFLFSAHTGTQTNAVNVDSLYNGQVIPELNPVWYLVVGLVPLGVWQWWSRRRLAQVIPVRE